jgi:hypothetical protein
LFLKLTWKFADVAGRRIAALCAVAEPDPGSHAVHPGQTQIAGVEAEAVEQGQDDPLGERVRHIGPEDRQVDRPAPYITPIQVQIDLFDGVDLIDTVADVWPSVGPLLGR